MSNKVQLRSSRAFYENSAVSKLTTKFMGIVPSGDEPALLIDINHGAKALTATLLGSQIVDGGTNTLLTYETSEQIHSVDEIRITNGSLTVPSVFIDAEVANNVRIAGANGGYDSDSWDYKIVLDTDGSSAIGYTGGEHGIRTTAGKAGHNIKEVRQFTIDDAGEIIIEANGERTFGKSCTVSIEGVQKASIPLRLNWSETFQNYSLQSTQLIYLYDTFTELIGATVGFSISEHN